MATPKNEAPKLAQESPAPPAAPPQPQSTAYDPIESAMRDHPGLTRERALQEAEAFGF